MNIKYLLSICFLLSVSRFASAQYGATGSWKVHLPYQNATSLTIDGYNVYVGGPSGIFIYNTNYKSVETLSKSNGLAQLSVSAMKFHPDMKMLMVVYDNADIDLVKNGVIVNIPDIARKVVIGQKRINHIYFSGKLAYLSGTLGIIVVDLERQQIKDSYTAIGANGAEIEVNSCCIYNNNIYAATHQGIYAASLSSPNLQDYHYWSVFKPSNRSKVINAYKGKLYAEVDSVLQVYDGSNWSFLRGNVARRNYAIEETNGNLVICQQDETYIIWADGGLFEPFVAEPLVAVTNNGRQVYYLTVYEQGLNIINSYTGATDLNIYPNGPKSNTAADFAVNGPEIWVAGGNAQNYSISYNPSSFYKYADGLWTSYSDKHPAGLDTLRDVVAIAVNPTNQKVYLGSFGTGLYEYDQGTNSAKAFNENNSTLGRPPGDPNNPLKISKLRFDADGNLWVCNFGAVSPLSVYTNDGQWISYSFGSSISSTAPLTDMEIDGDGRKWIAVIRANGVLVFDDKGTLSDKTDDQYRVLRQGGGGNGGLPSNEVTCLAIDHDGEVWIGTQAGLAVHFNPDQVFEGADASQIVIGKGSDAAYLLGTEYINCITVDGGNRKWIGTSNGVWLLSPDGTQVIHKFTESNSPLISDNVMDVAINPVTGEVMMITDKGLISFFGDATEGGNKHGNVFIYPNPVRPGYTGVISIRGLPEKANVKITDINGGLVYETVSNGGTATWNGRNFSGTKVSTGVYLVFSSNQDGSDTFMSKILFIN